jgi:hypothetical protein
VQRAVAVDVAGAVYPRAKAVVGAEQLQRAAHRDQLCGRSGHEQLFCVQRVDRFARIERVELDAEDGVLEFGPGENGVDSFRQRSGPRRLRCGLDARREHKHGDEGCTDLIHGGHSKPRVSPNTLCAR